jgi:glycosyltransferase involved in cell wall biosynthesis
VVHEAPPVEPLPPARPGPERRTVLYVCIFAPDDPVHEVLEALSGLDEISLRVTGQPPLGFDVGRYPGVEFTGYLRGPRYREALERADIVLSLTTEPTSAVRVGFEAVFGRRPLVVSDWPLLREAFPYAVHVENTAPGIRQGILRAVEDWEELARDADRALEVTERRWSEQLGVLRRRLGLDDGGASRRGPAGAPSGAIAGG